MLMGATDFTPLRFSTSALPVRERVPLWREVFARELVSIEIEPLSDQPFQCEATLRALPGLRSVSWANSAARFERTPQIVADGDDAVAVVVNLGGTMSLSQRDRDVSFGPGDAVPVLHAEPALMTHSQNKLGVVVPRAALAPLVTDVEDAAMRLIPHDNAALRLLVGYLKAMGEGLTLATPALRHLAVTHVHDLVAMTIGANRDGAAIAADRGVRAARLAVIKADIIARLDRRDLALVALAARQQVTPRYIQKLFEADGVTFSQFVLDQRRARAHRMLSDPRCAGQSVSTIAFAAGFGDLSYFNRVFRARYGATPSDVRAGTQRGNAR